MDDELNGLTDDQVDRLKALLEAFEGGRLNRAAPAPIIQGGPVETYVAKANAIIPAGGAATPAGGLVTIQDCSTGTLVDSTMGATSVNNLYPTAIGSGAYHCLVRDALGGNLFAIPPMGATSNLDVVTNVCTIIEELAPGDPGTTVDPYHGGTGLTSVGSDGYVLTASAGSVVWAAPSGGGGGDAFLAVANAFTAKQTITVTSAATSAPVETLSLRAHSSGTPAAGFGAETILYADSATVANRAAGVVATRWITATDATRESRLDISAYSTTNAPVAFSAGATITTPKLSFYGATPAVQPNITGSRAGNAALASLLTQLATLGLIIDSST